uniref:Ig-like domain-containing protein n=1 Tax=Sinocyclocheilus rhinocerous TaxID=307959 RepID=A0A673L882_9TELE
VRLSKTLLHIITKGQITVTQSPSLITAAQGQEVRINCKTSSRVYDGDEIQWYLQKPGEAPKLLIYETSNRYTGTPSRFSGSCVNKYFGVLFQTEDTGDYYCQSLHLISGIRVTVTALIQLRDTAAADERITNNTITQRIKHFTDYLFIRSTKEIQS